MLQLTKIGMKISGKEYYGVTNPSFLVQLATICEKKSWREMEE